MVGWAYLVEDIYIDITDTYAFDFRISHDDCRRLDDERAFELLT